MAVEIEIDLQVLKREIKRTYASVSQEPEKDFIFPTGRPWTEDRLPGRARERARDRRRLVRRGRQPVAAGPARTGRAGARPRLWRRHRLAHRRAGVLAPAGRIQIADVTIQNPVSEEGRRNIDLWTG